MTDEQINEKIAEACGWRLLANNRWTQPDGFYGDVPNYCNDLNAMHEAEGELFSKLDWIACEYENLLQKITVSWAWYATARQRAEAFLRTLNLWEE